MWEWLSGLLTNLQGGANLAATPFMRPTMVQGPPKTDPVPFYKAPFGMPGRQAASAHRGKGTVLYGDQNQMNPFVQRHEIGHVLGPTNPDLSAIPEWALRWAEQSDEVTGRWGRPLDRADPADIFEVIANLYYLGFWNPPGSPLMGEGQRE